MMRLLSTLLITFLSSSPAFASGDAIQWREGTLLTMFDFQGSPPATQLDLSVASSNTTIGLTHQWVGNQGLVYTIFCTFSRSRSWMSLRKTYILEHEQGHFDLTEVFARKLNQQLLAARPRMTSSNHRAIVDEIFRAVTNEKEAWQKRYDAETEHSMNPNRQAEWLERIRQSLFYFYQHRNYPKP